MNIKKRIRKNKITASKFADELIREDVMYKSLEINAKLSVDFNEAAKIRVLLEGIDKAYSYCILNLKLLRFVEIVYNKRKRFGISDQEIIAILSDVEESIHLTLKYAITQKHFYAETEMTYDIAGNIVYYNELRDHMRLPEQKVKQLNYTIEKC